MERIRLNHPHEMLALFPYLFGFKPKESVVLVALTGIHGRVGGPVARVDAPRVHAGIIDVALEFVDTFCVKDLYIGWYGSDLHTMLDDRDSVDILDTVGLACQQLINMRTGGDGCVTVGMTDYDSWAACLDARHGTWEDLCAEDLVMPFAELEAAPAVAQAVFDGNAPAGREPPQKRMRLEWPERRDAVAAARAWKGGKRRGVKLWQGVLDALDAGADPASAIGSEETAGQLIAAMHDILLRDQLILFGVDKGTVKMGGISAQQLMKKLSAVREPAPERIGIMIDLFEYLAERSDDAEPAPAAMAGYLSWWQGDTDRALMNAVLAIGSDYTYPLAKLVMHALHVNLPSPKDYPLKLVREREPSWNGVE
ncbi:DUF4192 family protein [Trueperella bernardiae]|nr:DUF4192 family protein [Trueperella bernardiae]WIM08684.1 DUF4192 family protein [Trueperella bernardiae]